MGDNIEQWLNKNIPDWKSYDSKYLGRLMLAILGDDRSQTDLAAISGDPESQRDATYTYGGGNTDENSISRDINTIASNMAAKELYKRRFPDGQIEDKCNQDWKNRQYALTGQYDKNSKPTEEFCNTMSNFDDLFNEDVTEAESPWSKLFFGYNPQKKVFENNRYNPEYWENAKSDLEEYEEDPSGFDGNIVADMTIPGLMAGKMAAGMARGSYVPGILDVAYAAGLPLAAGSKLGKLKSGMANRNIFNAKDILGQLGKEANLGFKRSFDKNTYGIYDKTGKLLDDFEGGVKSTKLPEYQINFQPKIGVEGYLK